MSEGLEKLQTIGAQKIHEKTHIPLEHVQGVLHGSFESLSKVQFLGFVSILERDYAIDLSELRSGGIKFFEEKSKRTLNKGVFMPQPKKSNFTSFYIFLALLVFASLIYITLQSPDEAVEKLEVDSSLIMDVQKDIEAASIQESNLTNAETNATLLDTNETSDETNETLAEPEAAPVELSRSEALASADSLKIVTQKKLWIGYIDRAEDKHYNKTFVGELELDANKEWLLFFGHRFVDVIIKGEKFQVASQSRARFFYKDGVLKSVDAEEFKALNKGKEW